MSFIVTLIAADRLTDEIVRDATRILVRSNCGPRPFAWIDTGSAGRFVCESDADTARRVLAPLHDRIDVVVSDGEPEFQAIKLLIADMDSTMITVECIDELADYAGIKPQIAAITTRAMRGDLDFGAALSERVALLAGLDEGVIAQCLAERVTLMPGARTLVQTMKARGARCVLVSGGFTRFAEPVAEMIGFDVAIANVLEVTDGVLTGRVREPIVDSGTKLATLRSQCAAMGIDPSQALAVGDGANDVPMLVAAGLGIAYHAHPKAVEAASAAIRHGDLTALLWAQGIGMADWVVASPT